MSMIALLSAVMCPSVFMARNHSSATYAVRLFPGRIHGSSVCLGRVSGLTQSTCLLVRGGLLRSRQRGPKQAFMEHAEVCLAHHVAHKLDVKLFDQRLVFEIAHYSASASNTSRRC